MKNLILIIILCLGFSCNASHKSYVSNKKMKIKLNKSATLMKINSGHLFQENKKYMNLPLKDVRGYRSWDKNDSKDTVYYSYDQIEKHWVYSISLIHKSQTEAFTEIIKLMQKVETDPQMKEANGIFQITKENIKNCSKADYIMYIFLGDLPFLGPIHCFYTK